MAPLEMIFRVQGPEAHYCLIECMLSAMRADGEGRPEVWDFIRGQLRHGEIFADMSPAVSKAFIARADGFCKGGKAIFERLPELAAGLAGRNQRMVAYALACEVCLVDRDLSANESAYLDKMAAEFGLEGAHAKDLFAGACQRRGVLTACDLSETTSAQLPAFLRCMALVAVADRKIHPNEPEAMRRLVCSLPDFAVLSDEELERSVQKTLLESTLQDGLREIERAAAAVLTGENDGFWALVYMWVIALADGVTHESESELLAGAADLFGLSAVEKRRARVAAESMLKSLAL